MVALLAITSFFRRRRLVTTINFEHIRATPKSKNDSFESMSIILFKSNCCVTEGSSFFSLRGAGGDGGVEAYYKSPQGNIFAVQAKYFFRLDNTTLSQIKNSLTTAIDNYPLLVEYWIYLPFDLTGPTGRSKPGNSEIEKYEKWQDETKVKYPNLKIKLISAELIREQIIKFDSTGGFASYWFGNNILTKDKIQTCIDASEAFAGPRYCSDLDITTEAYDTLDAFGEIYDFQNWTDKVWKPLLRELRKNIKYKDYILSLCIPEEKQKIGSILDNFWESVSNKKNVFDRKVIEILLEAVNELKPYIKKVVMLQEESFISTHGNNSDNPSFRQYHAEWMCDFPAQNMDFSRELRESIYEIDKILNSPLIQSCFAHSFLMTGPAGSGKTHSLVSFAKRRIKLGGYTLVLFGEELDGTDPWSAVRDKLGFGSDVGRDKLLDCLQACAYASSKSFVIIIDALNESVKAKKWKNKLPEMIEQCKKYDCVKIVVSTRDVHSNLVVENRFPGYAYNHIGFTRNFNDILNSFSRRYNVESEITPSFIDELRNPLLLHLIFKVASKSGTRFIDISSNGFIKIFYEYLEQIDNTLRDRLGYVNPRNLVKAVMTALTDMLTNLSSGAINWDVAAETVGSVIGADLSPDRFIDELINEKLLILSPVGDDEYNLRFGYQRFGDVLRARSILSSCRKGEHLDIADLKNKVSSLLEEGQGVVESLASVLPEEEGIEIVNNDLGIASEQRYKFFIGSLVWRSRGSITEEVEEHILEALKIGGLWQTIFETLFKLFLVPDHYLNVENWFKKFQWRQTQPSRDAYLSIALIESYENKNAIWLFLEMVENIIDTNWPKASYKLAASALLWCCSATDRRIRDRASKSLTLLFKQDPALCEYAVDEFNGCNDDYIQERLILAMYSACLLYKGNMEIFSKSLEKYIQYNQESSNILIREHALLLKQKLKNDAVDSNFIQPMFPSKWPVLSDVKKLLTLDKLPINMKLWGNQIKPDFWRYIVQSIIRDFDFHSLGVTDENIACWIMDEAIKLGYPGYKDGALAHDRATISKYGSGRAKPGYAETIGKKCYWIALHRLVGVLSNNTPIVKTSWEPQLNSNRYWSLSLRDIDVSDIGKISVNRDYPSIVHIPCRKKFPTESLDAWLDVDDYCTSDEVLVLKDNKVDTRWINLSFYSVSSTGLDKDDNSLLSLYRIAAYDGYFVNPEDVEDFELNNLAITSSSEIYLAEYPDTPAFKQCIAEQDVSVSDEHRKFVCLQFSRGKSWEYDYSNVNEQYPINLPCPDIIEKMKLCWDYNNGWLDKDNELAVFNYSSEELSALFIRKDILDSYLLDLNKVFVIGRYIRKQYSEEFENNAKLTESSSRYSYNSELGFKLLNYEKT